MPHDRIATWRRGRRQWNGRDEGGILPTSLLGGPLVSEEQNPQRCDFFVSYTGADSAWAEWIAWQLKEAGYTVTIQAWHFRPGMNFVAMMRQALDTCQRTLAVVSKAYLEQSIYGSDEWTAAFTHDDPTRSSLLMVLIEQVTLPRLLRPWIHLNLTGVAPEQAATRLLEGVHPGPVEPTAAPAFPGRVESGGGAGPRYPGHPPKDSNLPARNAAFAGRDDLLSELRHRLHQEGSTAAVVPAQAMYGLGGVGKTQLALEYAHRYQADYDLIWWIGAEAPGAIPAGLAELAARLDLVDDITQVADQEQLAAAVLKELHQRERWLLIFDNIPDREQLVPYLPQGDGRVLVTSRSPVWGGIARSVKVDTFSRTESLAFLTRRTGTHDEATAGELAEELGDLPLALEQAAAYLEQTGMPLADYLELFRRRREELLKLGEPTAYQGTVDTTWQLAIEQVATIKLGGKGGIALLRLCAFLAPEAIPPDLFTGHPDLLYTKLGRAARDELALQNAVAVLYRYSLVDRDGAGLRMHRLVQAVVRTRLAPQGRDAWAGLAVSLLEEAFPTQLHMPGTWPRCAQLVPHVLATAEHANTPQAAVIAATTLHRATEYLSRRAELRAARTAAERALATFEAVYGPEHPNVARTLGNLATVLTQLGDLAAARAALERCWTIFEVDYGPEHPDVARTLGNLGNVLSELGDLAAARAVLERALAIFEVVYGPEHPEVVRALVNLGGVLSDLGDLAGARAVLERALAIGETVLGPEHPEVAVAVSSLGVVLMRLGDLAGARAAQQRALAIEEAVYGPEHPNVARTLVNLGGVLSDLGDLAEARAVLERALAIEEAVFGPVHPNVARTLVDLGSVLSELGDLAEARAVHDRVLAIEEAVGLQSEKGSDKSAP
jgi:tetratricopeptide (TPR) repeat protein